MDGEREKFERTAACILIREFGSVSYDGAESDDEVFHIYEADEDGAEELKNFRELASELWQARASLPSAQPSDVVKAIEAISYCIKTIENHRIPEESNNIWSNGSTSRPHINLPILRTCLAALTAQQAQSLQVLREAWTRYKSAMRPETRNEYLRASSKVFDEQNTCKTCDGDGVVYVPQRYEDGTTSREVIEEQCPSCTPSAQPSNMTEDEATLLMAEAFYLKASEKGYPMHTWGERAAQVKARLKVCSLAAYRALIAAGLLPQGNCNANQNDSTSVIRGV